MAKLKILMKTWTFSPALCLPLPLSFVEMFLNLSIYIHKISFSMKPLQTTIPPIEDKNVSHPIIKYSGAENLGSVFL